MPIWGILKTKYGELLKYRVAGLVKQNIGSEIVCINKLTLTNTKESALSFKKNKEPLYLKRMHPEKFKGECVPELKQERGGCWFNQLEITHFVDGGPDKTVLRKKLEKYFFNDPEFLDPINPNYLNHGDKYANELRKICAILKKTREDEELSQLVEEIGGIRMLLGSGIGSSLTKDGNPLALHYVMFLPAIMGQGTEEQIDTWIGRAWTGKIIGAYAQTEMGHGTFLRGLETTATYDSSTEEFILNSPTISSYKFWPGGLGKTANYALVMAQLNIKKQFYGPHAFMVQIRDEETHKSLPDIKVGEMGPRFGMNTNDNGFLAFNQYRIPLNHMLMKHSKVLKDGTYIKPSNSKLTYGTMVMVRAAICFGTTRQLLRAVTIATRYSAVRRQSELIPGEPEPQIMDYQTQQDKLFPYISAIFGLILTSRSLWDTYVDVSQKVELGNLESLPEMHALSCGLKAQFSTDCTDGVDVCRRSCGGNGYLSSSNFTRIYTTVSAAMTYEGENTVMWLQCARYIVKLYKQGSSSVAKTLTYLHGRGILIDQSESHLSNAGLLRKWEQSIKSHLAHIVNRLDYLTSIGHRYEMAWNQCSVELVKCAKAHIRYFTCLQYVEKVGMLRMSSTTKDLLQKLCRLYVVYYFIENQGLFLRNGFVTPGDLARLEDELCQLYAFVRPNAVNIVDAFDIHDRILDSTLGSWDGNVYERMYKECKQSPLNKHDVTEAYYQYLRPILKSKL